MTRLTGFAALLLVLVGSPALAEGPTLKGDVTVSRDSLTLADLVDNVPAELARTALFRAPALGASGTIQTARIVAAAQALGLGRIETGGRSQIAVIRAARTIGPTEIEAAIRKVLAREFGADPVSTGIVFDAPAPVLAVAPEIAGEVAAADVTLDRRSRRVSATVWLGPSPTIRRAQLRVSGVAVDTVEISVIARPIERGQPVRPGDITSERRPRDLVPADTMIDGPSLEGRVARRTLGAGALVRSSDLARPEIVARGDLVNVVYEVPGIALTLRAKATEAGALGDAITVVNPQTKKVLQATIIGPGRVSVASGLLPIGQPARVAAATAEP